MDTIFERRSAALISGMDALSNELKDRIISLIDSTPYSLISFEYSRGCFGNVIVIVKNDSTDCSLRFTRDRNDIYIESLNGKEAEKAVAAKGWKGNLLWSNAIFYAHDKCCPNGDNLLLSAIAEHCISGSSNTGEGNPYS